MKSFLQVLINAIRKIWTFLVILAYAAVIIAVLFFFTAVIFPSNVQNAIELIASYITPAG